MHISTTFAQLAAALMWTLFSGWYILRAKWWKTPFGWNTLGVSLILAAIFLRLAVLRLHPSFTRDLEVTGLVFYSLAAILGGHRLFLLEKAQRQPSRGRRSTDK